MFKEIYNVVGVMSGTSLDGIDLAKIKFRIKDGIWNFEIHETATIPYTYEWCKMLKNASNLNRDALQLLDKNYTQLLGETIHHFIHENKIEALDAVCSHGHTVLHQPHNGFTFQMGNLPEISKIIQQKVVCNFRVKDVKLGGQGAPLVPIGDKYLFNSFDYCINLGGFSNISYETEGKRIAYDICAVNTVLNYYAQKLGVEYDKDGEIAASGTCHEELLDSLNSLVFYAMKAPKSLGIEYVNQTMVPLIDTFQLEIKDVLNTFCHHVAIQIIDSLQKENCRVLLTGGGAYHKFLIHLLKLKGQNIDFVIPESKIIEFKEALIFGLLGVLRLRNENNVLASVTGAPFDHSSGDIFEK
jgi:anhydro-N-acetylmuramic acid kinase